MTTYGVTAAGFVRKPLLVIKGEIEDALKAVFGASIDLAPQSVFGQLVGIMAERESEQWDAAQAVYSAFDPDAASGAAQDSVCAMTGTARNPATRSTVPVTFTGTPGTSIPAGFQGSVTGTGVKFETASILTIGGGGTVTGTMTAVDTGPLPALTGTLTVIETPVDGLTSVTNAADATLGRDVESDADLRLRRETELRTPANAATAAIRAHLLALDGVTGAVVFENTSSVTDSDGIPPYHIRAVVNGGTATAIRASIFATKAAGTGTYGTISGTVVDDQGISHTISYDAATLKPVWVILNVTKDPLTYPADGDAQVRDAVLAYGSMLVMGKNVVSGALAAKAFAISGVLEVECLIGLSNPPTTSTTIPIGITEQAELNSARVTVTSVDGTP